MRRRAARPRRLALGLVCAVGLGLGWTGEARGQLSEQDLAALGVPFVCEREVAIFESLRYGEFDFCRQHLRYVPGSLDCLRILVPTCNVSSSVQPTWAIRSPEDRVRAGHAERIVCPPGPPPPTCPAGFPAGPIPGP